MKNELENMWNDDLEVKFDEISCHLRGITKENLKFSRLLCVPKGTRIESFKNKSQKS